MSEAEGELLASRLDQKKLQADIKKLTSKVGANAWRQWSSMLQRSSRCWPPPPPPAC